MKIKFINTTDLYLEIPQPSDHIIPEWYKKTESYVGGIKRPSVSSDEETKATIKRCMPVFDAITAGYIITSPFDVYVSIRKEDNTQAFQWPDKDKKFIQFHPIDQAPLHPNKNLYSYPKWLNPWSIVTPKGYSCLFVQPFHRESVFTIFPGIVDTDNYHSPVNFPFVINNVNFEGMIPKGTPIAQVIPFKRDTWKSTEGNKKDLSKVNRTIDTIRSMFFDGYKINFWDRKHYK